VTVDYGARFKRQVHTAQRWLDEHGPPAEIADELAWLIDDLKRNSEMWALVANARMPGTRRAYLERIDYHVYYRIHARRDVIQFRDFRHARRRPIRM
jgi:hypothetical protein